MSKKSLLIAVPLTASLAFASAPADAAPEGTIKSISASLVAGGGLSGPLIVVSDDGETYSRIRDDTSLYVEGDVSIKMKTGKIKVYGIYWGQCSGDACFQQAGTPLIFSDQTGGGPGEINKYPMFDVSTGLIPGNAYGNPALPPPPGDGYHIIAACNAWLANGGDIHAGHGFTANVPMTVAVDTYWGLDQPAQAWNGPGLFPLGDVDGQETVPVPVPVECQAVPEVEEATPPLLLLTASLSVSPDDYAGACPVDLTVSWYARTNIAGTLEARVEAKTGWKSVKKVFQTTTAYADGTFGRAFDDVLTVPVTIPVGQSDGGAMDTASGIGDVAIDQTPPDDEIIPTGTVPAGPGQVAAGHNPGNLHEDSLRLVVSGNGQTIVTDWSKYRVVCDPKVNPAVGSLPDGIVLSTPPAATFDPPDERQTTPTSPTPVIVTPAPTVPPPPAGPVILPRPQIACTGGTVENGQCVCAPGKMPVKAAANAYRCLARPAILVAPVTPQPPPPGAGRQFRLVPPASAAAPARIGPPKLPNLFAR